MQFIGLIFYFVGMPLILWLIAFGYKRLYVNKQAEKIQRKRLDRVPPSPVGGKWKRHVSFTLRDKRDIVIGKSKKKENGGGLKLQRNITAYVLFGLALVPAILFIFTQDFAMLAWIFIGFMIAFSFAVISPTALLAQRQKIVQKIFEIASPQLGISQNKDPNSVIRITDWRDYEIPNKIEIDVPTNFSSSGEESFLKQFNQVFGKITAWVPDVVLPSKDENGNDVPGKPGWDYENGKVELRAVPPLPLQAPWLKHYIEHPAIAWSFFPLGLGVENGVELPNPISGEVEHVLGVDFSGKQPKAGKAAGVPVSNRIIKTPMILIAGGTGGGKSLDSNLMVTVVRKREEQSPE